MNVAGMKGVDQKILPIMGASGLIYRARGDAYELRKCESPTVVRVLGVSKNEFPVVGAEY